VHLIFSNIITEKRLWINKDVTKNVRRSRASMAASTLHSMRKLLINSADVFLEFDETTEESRAPLFDFIRTLPFDVNLHEHRLDSFDRWRKASLDLKGEDSGQILLFTNEDHLLLPGAEKEFEYISALQNKLQEELPENVVMVPLSHFPESHAVIPVAKLAGRLIQKGAAPLVPCQIPAGPILLSKTQFRNLWANDFTKGSKFVGLENPFGNSLRLTNGLYLPPRRELFRHFDSYGHVRVSHWPYNLIEPNIQILAPGASYGVDFDYEISASLASPENLDLGTVASENSEESSVLQKLEMSMLKAGSKRPSITSFRWVATQYEDSKAEIARSIWSIWKVSNSFRKAIIARVIDFPGHVLLGIAGRFTAKLRPVDLEYVWFMTYGSGVGYFRLLKLSWPNVLRKLGFQGQRK
jgi:hypothetical protein